MLKPTDRRLVCLLESYQRFFGSQLCSASELFEAPFVVLAHGTEVPPILFYGNRLALRLWELDFETFTGMPSLKTAEPDERDARETLLAEVARQGYSTGYRGVRISSTGKRFEIQQATVWNLLDENEQRIGQAATFRDWVWVP